MSPGSPATFSTFNLSSAATRYCLPPVLMTANIFPSCSYPRLRRPGAASCSVGLCEWFQPPEAAKTQNERVRPKAIPHAAAYGESGSGLSRKAEPDHGFWPPRETIRPWATLSAGSEGIRWPTPPPPRSSARTAPSCCRRSRSTATTWNSRTTRASSATARAGSAFHAILENWRKPLRKLGADPFGDDAVRRPQPPQARRDR